MKSLKFVLSFFVALATLPLPLITFTASAQDQQAPVTAIMRGYRTGYSDGYPAGASDAATNAPREFRNKAEYDRGDRAYNPNWGSLDEYRDGYRQGFEVGYGAGYARKPFDSSIPTDLKRRTEENTVQYPVDPNKRPGDNSVIQPASGMVIPRDTIMVVELLNHVSTDVSQKGDRFQVRVVDPNQYRGAVLEGHIEQVKRPGKAKGTAQLQLTFDQIRFTNGQSAKFSAQVIEVIPYGGSQGVGKVDSEGGVKGQDSTKGDVGKVGAAAGIGAVLGAIFGGGSGAAIGATIGAGVGTAGVLNQRGKDIQLSEGQQLRIRTAGDAEIQ